MYNLHICVILFKINSFFFLVYFIVYCCDSKWTGNTNKPMSGVLLAPCKPWKQNKKTKQKKTLWFFSRLVLIHCKQIKGNKDSLSLFLRPGLLDHQLVTFCFFYVDHHVYQPLRQLFLVRWRETTHTHTQTHTQNEFPYPSIDICVGSRE